mgnify:CR=1 FL=1
MPAAIVATHASGHRPELLGKDGAYCGFTTGPTGGSLRGGKWGRVFQP